MTPRRIDVTALLALLEEDREFLERCFEEGILPRAEGFVCAEAERARVARVLVRDLDVNWPGVEIILRLTEELDDLRRDVAEMARLLASRRRG